MKKIPTKKTINTLSIHGGENKEGKAGKISLYLNNPEIICIVGPTGSGKSRLLEDIEWMAGGDTPTKRKIVINNNNSVDNNKYFNSQKLVAQLSQNMNFVMDMSVKDFIKMHAECCSLGNREKVVDQVVSQTNLLSGEKINKNMQITSLSGGQSRALMIADIACISTSSIVLIDEIENAGINRDIALKLLLSKGKFVFIATHDPILALMGDRRVVMKNGGIVKVIERTEKEQSVLNKLKFLNNKIDEVRKILLKGNKIEKFFTEL